MNEAVLSVRNLEAGYGKSPILRDIGLDLAPGEFVAVVGPNGSGKSTLMKSLVGFLPPISGDVLYNGKTLLELGRRKAARHVALVPQTTVFHFPYRVYDYVLLGRHPYRGLFSYTTEEDEKIVEEAMRRTEVWTLRRRAVTELSGGERQRVVLAAAFAQQTRVLLLDEPTNSLDLRHQLQVYELLSEMKRSNGLAVLAVTHDLNLASLHADRIVLIAEGRIVDDGPPERIVSAELMKRYFGVESTVLMDKQSNRPYALSHRSTSPQ